MKNIIFFKAQNVFNIQTQSDIRENAVEDKNSVFLLIISVSNAEFVIGTEHALRFNTSYYCRSKFKLFACFSVKNFTTDRSVRNNLPDFNILGAANYRLQAGSCIYSYKMKMVGIRVIIYFFDFCRNNVCKFRPYFFNLFDFQTAHRKLMSNLLYVQVA